MNITPQEGFKGLIENWQSDLLAAVSVSLVALPLALGIAYASNVPPMTGVVSAIIGGIVTTLFRGSHVAINGPAAGLIAVILSSLSLWEGDPHALNYVLAAIVVSGGVQIILGLLRLGKLAELFHSSVIHGILAAIGVIIFAKQIHVAMGTTSTSINTIDSLVDAIQQIPNINPFVATISLAGLILLIYQSKISYRLFHLIPAPMWVLVVSIPFVYFFDFFDAHSINLLGRDYEVGPHLLVDIPSNIANAITHPDFSMILTWKFWTSVISITMIASIESLASSKAVDKLDPYKRKTDLNKDLIGIGISTMVSGAVGGLPIITVIVRSTVNVHNHAKTKWSNFYHGILLLAFIFLLTPVITKVPLAALATLLVYTGYRLASPKVFKHVLDTGIEQLILFTGTLAITLFTDLLIGVFGGLLLALITHFLLAKVSIREFFEQIFYSRTNLIINNDGSYNLRVRGIANFLGAIKMNTILDSIPKNSNVKIDLSEASLVDFAILEKLYDYQRAQANNDVEVSIVGLDHHKSSTNHRFGLRLLPNASHKLNKRERGIKEIGVAHGYSYIHEPNDWVEYFQKFYFFKSRPIEFKKNCIWTRNKDFKWEISDIIFEEGAFMAFKTYKATMALLIVPFNIPKFTIEKKDFIDKYIEIHPSKDIDYKIYSDFSEEYIVKVEDTNAMEQFLTEELKSYFIKHDIHHVESSGEAILIFPNRFRLVHIDKYPNTIELLDELRGIISKRNEVI